MRFMLLFFIPLALFAEALPVMHKGRIRPLEVIEKPFSEDLLLLPSKNGASWHPLSKLSSSNSNFTPYSALLFKDLKFFFEKKEMEKVKKILITGYGELQGKKGFPSTRKLYAEQLYYKVPWQNLAIASFLSASLLFFFGFRKSGGSLGIMGALLLSFILGLRVYILGRPPVANMHETLLYVPWVAALLTLGLIKRTPNRFLTLIFAVLAVLISFSGGEGELENVQAVLNSRFWLMIHVLMIVASYAILIVSGVLGHYYLLSKDKSVEKPMISTLYFGTAVLISGTILGGIWAQNSWGRFWDWDPKESWAFISAAIYLIFIHTYRYGKVGIFGLSIGAIIGLMAISFTWYGVNYILGTGLHSYGFGNGGEIPYFLFLGAETLFILYFLIISSLKNKLIL